VANEESSAVFNGVSEGVHDQSAQLEPEASPAEEAKGDGETGAATIDDLD